jgi:putative membrane protein
MKFKLLSAAALLLFLHPAFAQDNATGPTTANEFVPLVAMSDTFELLSSGLAEKQSNNNSIKSYAQHLVKDHAQSSHELLTLAKQAGIEVPLPAPLDQKHQAMIDQLSQMTGPEFDQAFTRMQVAAHEDAIKLFMKYAKYGDNQAIRSFAMTTLPVLQKHLQAAQSQTTAQK